MCTVMRSLSRFSRFYRRYYPKMKVPGREFVLDRSPFCRHSLLAFGTLSDIAFAAVAAQVADSVPVPLDLSFGVGGAKA